jgi:dCMP deaminase
MREPWDWDMVWMNVALVIKERSKDPDTQVGSVVVSPDNRKVYVGYNGFPAGVKDTVERWKRPHKYDLVIHAEDNALLNAKEDLEGWTLYLTLYPCVRCATDLIQAGIKRLVYLEKPDRPDSKYDLSTEIMTEAGILIEEYEGPHKGAYGWSQWDPEEK